MRAWWLACIGGMAFVACAPDRYATGAPAGAPLPGLSTADLARFERGKALFARGFTPGDGLGPLFNEDRCSSCHDLPTTGGTGVETALKATRFTPPDSCDLLSAEGGEAFQDRATPLLQARGVERDSVPRRANGRTRLIPPVLFGLGLVDAVPERDIAPGRRGRTQDGRPGRFGFKADRATLVEFVEGALHAELGLTTPRILEEERPNGAPLPAGVDPAADPEVPDSAVALLADFVRFLAPPPAILPAAGAARDSLRRGEALFGRLGCPTCHTPVMRTGPSPTAPLDRKIFQLYSDLVLHDLGNAAGDVCGAGAAPGEVRTARLWGLRYRTSYMHDGRATTLEQAVMLHGGEAAAARDGFARLGVGNQGLLLRFLSAL